MKHTKDPERVLMIGFIELLNEMGFNVVWIDSTFYAFNEFIPIDENINEIELSGRDITSLVENETATAASNHLKKNELISRISEMKPRRRQFPPNTPYTKFLAN